VLTDRLLRHDNMFIGIASEPIVFSLDLDARLGLGQSVCLVFSGVNAERANQSSLVALFGKVVFAPEELVAFGDDVVPDQPSTWVIVS